MIVYSGLATKVIAVFVSGYYTVLYIVQSLDDDGDLPELEGGRAVNKSDNKAENNSTGKDDTPTEEKADSIVEKTALLATNEQPSTVEDNQTRNDTAL